MEDALVLKLLSPKVEIKGVLILVLMEDALVLFGFYPYPLLLVKS